MIQRPEDVIDNLDVIKEWLILIGLIVAVLVGIITLIGIVYTGVRKWLKHKEENNG